MAEEGHFCTENGLPGTEIQVAWTEITETIRSKEARFWYERAGISSRSGTKPERQRAVLDRGCVFPVRPEALPVPAGATRGPTVAPPSSLARFLVRVPVPRQVSGIEWD